MMSIEQIWLLKLVLAHLLTDFVFQPGSWVANRRQKHFLSPKLYLHGLVTGIGALVFIGWAYWPVVLVVMVSHTIIDGWKSYRRELLGWFVLDQVLHLAVILACWYWSFYQPADLRLLSLSIGNDSNFWALTAAVVFLTAPCGILIGQLTRRWREQIANPETLANAGKWIGFIERLIVLMLVLVGQFAAISLLIAAKGIIRFNEKDRPEVKTEYLVIGTLMSIGIAMMVGMGVRFVLS